MINVALTTHRCHLPINGDILYSSLNKILLKARINKSHRQEAVSEIVQLSLIFCLTAVIILPFSTLLYC